MLINRSDFKTNLLISLTKYIPFVQSRHSNLSLCQHDETLQDFIFQDPSAKNDHDDVLKHFDGNMKLYDLYIKMIAALYIEKFNYIEWYDKIKRNKADFEEAISFILTPSKFNDYDFSELEDFLPKFINFVNTFDDENIKIRLANYFINSEPVISKLIGKGAALLVFDSSYKTLLFLQKILGSPNLKKFFVDTNKSETLDPDDLTNFIEEYFSLFIQDKVPPPPFEETLKRMAMVFVPIIQQSKEEILIKAIQNLISKYICLKESCDEFHKESCNEFHKKSRNKFPKKSCNEFPKKPRNEFKKKDFFDGIIRMLLFSIMNLKENTYSDIFEKIQSPPRPGISKRLFSTLADSWGIFESLKEILLISNFIKEKSNSADEKQKSFEFLSNKSVFEPFYYTKFKKIMQALLKKIESEDFDISFIKENNKNNQDTEASIAVFKIEKLISYFSNESLEFYKHHFIEFLNHEMKISTQQIYALTIKWFFSSAVACYKDNELLLYSRPFGKQFFIEDSDTLKTDLKHRAVEISEIGMENSFIHGYLSLSDRITLKFQDSQFFYKPTEASEASDIIIEKGIPYVFASKLFSKRITEIVLSGLLSSLPGTDKNDLIIQLMKLCPFHCAFNENSAWKLFCFLRKMFTRELPEDLVFFENVFLFISTNSWFRESYCQFRSFYAFFREKDFPTVDRCLEIIFEKSKDDEEISFLLKLFIPAYKLLPIGKNIDFISKIYNLYLVKNRNSALNFIKYVLDWRREWRESFNIESANLSKLIDKIVSGFIYDENPDFFTLISIFERANSQYSSKLNYASFYFLKDSLENSNIDEADKIKLLERIETLNKQK